MAIVRTIPTLEAAATEYRRILQPFIQDESGVEALRGCFGEKNEINREGMYLLEILNNVISSNNETEKIFQRIPPEVFGGMPEGGRRNVQASLIARTVQGTDRKEQTRVGPSGYTRIQELIGHWAERDGSWTDTPQKNLIEKGYKHKIQDDGSEARIYDLERGGDRIVKTLDFSHYSHFEQMLDRIAIHNATFPEMAMRVDGFGMRDDAGDNTGFVVIISQKKAVGRTPTSMTRMPSSLPEDVCSSSTAKPSSGPSR